MAKKCVTDAQLAETVGVTRAEWDALTSAEQIRELGDIKGELNNHIRQGELQAVKYGAAEDIIRSYVGPDGKVDVKRGLQALLYRDRRERSRIIDGEGVGGDLDSKIQAVRAKYQGQVYDMMEELGNRWFGKDKFGTEQLLKAIYGEGVDAKFTKMANDWARTIEAMRERFNRAGGDIKMLKDWGLPRVDSAVKIKRMGEANWINFVKKHADLERMRQSNHGVPIDDEVLKKMYSSIVSDGLSGDLPTGKRAGRMANRHQEKRMIHFKDADSWLAYHNELGEGTPYNAMMDYVSMMSNEIAMLETLGPNPTATFDALAAMVDAETLPGRSGAKPSSVANKVYKNLSGQTNPDNMTAAKVNEAIRNYTSAVKLPMAVLSAPPDVLTNAIQANYNGFSGMAMMKDITKMLATANTKESRRLAADLGMQLDFMVDTAHAAGRYFDVGGHGASAKMAGFTIKGGGLNHWTVANKMAFHFGFARELGKSNIKSNKQLMKSFERYGIDEKMIDEIISSKKMVRNGSTFMDGKELSDATSEAVGAMIAAETRLAVPEADVRVKAFLNQGTKRGDTGGEALRFMTMFKTFPTSILMNNWARIIHGTGYGSMGRAGMAASLLVGTTVLGVMSLQMKEIAKTKTPNEWGEDGAPFDWDSKQLWIDGFKQGGGISIISDILSADARNFGSLADFLGGPAVGALNDIFWRGALGNIDDAVEGERQALDYAKGALGASAKYVPGFFYSKAILDRLILDNVRRLGDDNYDIKKMRRKTKKDDEYSEKWW